MATIRSVDMMLLEEIFAMESGYVLDFSNPSMTRFYANDLNVDIDHPRYRAQGDSKAKRTRALLAQVTDVEAARVLRALWGYRQAMLQRRGDQDPVINAEGKFQSVLARLEGRSAPNVDSGFQTAEKAFDWSASSALLERLLTLRSMDPHPRGFAFESFLQDLFLLYDLAPRGAFRLQGEQIDGSFQHSTQTYLLEAKWHNAPTPAADLHIFEGKLREKVSWSRGLFVSHTGYSPDGLEAFGRDKRLICMDGLDLFETLNRKLPLGEVISRKARRAVETGRVFVPVRELFA